MTEWEPEAETAWDQYAAAEEQRNREELIKLIKNRFGFTRGDTLIVRPRSGDQRTLVPDYLIGEIIKMVRENS